jgi:hypothetical protein
LVGICFALNFPDRNKQMSACQLAARAMSPPKIKTVVPILSLRSWKGCACSQAWSLLIAAKNQFLLQRASDTLSKQQKFDCCLQNALHDSIPDIAAKLVTAKAERHSPLG